MDQSRERKLTLLLDQLTKEDHNDEETCRELRSLAKLLYDDSAVESSMSEDDEPSNVSLDNNHLDKILGYMDLRRPEVVRSHATITVSAYLKSTKNAGNERISSFLFKKYRNDEPDGYILAFSVAACLFPIIPDIISALFLSEGFVPSLEALLENRWRNKQIDEAVIELLNAACVSTPCRQAMRLSCTEWLERIVLDTPESSNNVLPSEKSEPEENLLPHQDPCRRHSQYVRNIASIVLAKLQATPSTPALGTEKRAQTSSISIEKLADDFKNMLFSGSTVQHSVEGLAYASLQPKVKEELVSDKNFLQRLIKALGEAPAKSPVTYGVLTIFYNLTSFKPVLSEEQKRLAQLKSYANATSPSKEDQLNEDDCVIKRCQAIFEAGTIPVLVTHSQHGSTPSLTLVVSIVNSLSRLPKIRGKMAQQGAIKLLINAYSIFPTNSDLALRTTAHALARILISTNPLHAFGGSNPISSAIRPLIHLLTDDPAAEQRDLLSIFESLLALTNLASTDDPTRNSILRLVCSQLDELVLSDNTLIARAAVELISNLVISPEGVSEFVKDQRLHIILALTDAQDLATRRAAGGALACLTGWEEGMKGVLKKGNGVKNLLALCVEDEEDVRHRGVVCILNIVSAPDKLGFIGTKKVKDEGGINAMKQTLKISKSQQVLNITVQVLKLLSENQESDLKLIANS